MGEVKKIGEEYFIEFYARGLLYQQKAGNDHAKAQQMLQEVERKIAQGEMQAVDRDVDWDIFKLTFLDHVESDHTYRTARRYRDLIDHFDEFLKQAAQPIKKLSQVTPSLTQDYQSYLKKIKVHPAMINFSLYLLREVLEYAIKLGYLNDNPTLHIRWLESVKPPPEYFDKSREDILAEASPPELKNKIVLVCSSRIQPEDVGDFFGIKNRRDLNAQLMPVVKALGWPQRDYALVLRNTLVNNLLQKKVRLINIYQLLGFNDIARVMYFFPLVRDKEMRMF